MPEISPNGARKRPVFVWSSNEEFRISFQQGSSHSTPEGRGRCELLLREIGGKIGQLQQDIAAQRAHNEQLATRNRQMAEEVRDLKQGDSAIEERARSELGLISADENYYQVVPQAVQAPPAEADPVATSVAAVPARPQRSRMP